ncbi:MAG TPA: carboxypeptidase regulatory-like domain-containing protein [Thermoanaerobaculia bacterium]
MRRVDFRWTLAVFAALLLSVAGPALAQLQTGDLYGTVVDQQGQPLPGSTISLEGMGAPQIQVTDEKGQFRFLGLYPGTYKMRAELEGFSTLEYPDILIRVGGKTSIEVTLTSAVEDVITVTGESPIIDERKLNQGTSVSAVELDKVPTARDPWSLLSQTPGVLVDRFNIGGNESGQQSNFVGYGSSSRDNVFAVDGVVLTDMNAVGASATYFDFGAFEEVQLTVSSADVTVATSGVTVNQVTKRGTNEWRGQGRYLRTDGGVQSEPDVLVNLRPVDDVFIPGNEIDSVEEYGADIGGPLWQDHLWIWASYGESDIGNIVGGGQLDTTQLEDLNTKMNFQIGQQNSGVLHYWTNDKLKFGRSAGPTRSPETTHDQTTPQDIYKIEDTFIPSSNFFVTGLWSRDDGIFTLAPQGGLDADIFEDESGILHGTYYDFRQDAIIDQGRLNASYFFDLGGSNHELKFGGGFREQENHSGTVWPRGKQVQAGENFDNTETEFVTFYRDRQIGILAEYDSAWVQDTMTLDRWTINAGVRYDKQTVENLASATQTNPFLPDLIPALSFAGNDAGGFEWETVVPRVGVTYALGEERDTLLRGTFSQYAEQLGQLPLANRVNPMGYAYVYFYFTDANNNLVLDPNEFGSLEFYGTYNIDPENPSALISPNVNDPNLDPAMTDEVTLGLEHALRTDLALGVTLIYRNIYDIPETRILIQDESGRTRFANRNDWVSATITRPLPDGRTSAPIPVYNLRAGLTTNGGRFYTNGDREQNYRGVSLTFNKRLANRWAMRGHFTYADWEWDIGPEYRFYEDPTDEVADDLGFADGDGDVFAERSGGSKSDVLVGGSWSFNLNGLYQVAPERPWGFNIGGSVDGREGYITPPFASRPGPAGSRRVQLTPDLDEFRHDDVIVLNLHLDKDFTFGDWNLNLGLDGFNLTNENVILQQQRNAGNRLGDNSQVPYYPTEALSPRVFRGGVTLRFR